MSNCNLPAKEMGGKELLLKMCIAGTVAVTATSAVITQVGHGLKIGDIIKFKTIDANTTINTTTFYYVKTVPSADTFTISLTRSGVSIVLDDTNTALEIDKFVGIGGLREKSFSFSTEGIDITNEDSDEWKVMLDKAGIRSLEVSASGVYSNYANAQTLQDKAIANELTCLMFIEYKTGRLYESCFKLTSVEISGSYDAESSLSISASSSGPVTIATIAA